MKVISEEFLDMRSSTKNRRGFSGCAFYLENGHLGGPVLVPSLAFKFMGETLIGTLFFGWSWAN